MEEKHNMNSRARRLVKVDVRDLRLYSTELLNALSEVSARMQDKELRDVLSRAATLVGALAAEKRPH